MRIFLAAIAAVLPVLLPAGAAAQGSPPTYRPSQPPSLANPIPSLCITWNGTALVFCGVGGGTGGAGDASAANQTSVQAVPGVSSTKAVGVQGVTGGLPVPVSNPTGPSLTNQAAQLAAEQAVQAAIGATTSPAPGSVNAQLAATVTQLTTTVTRLTSIVSALGSPFQAGGSIGNSSFAISGTLPGFATPPRVDTVLQATATDRGAIVGTTAVTLIPAYANRRWFSVQNQSQSASCYISGQATATADYHSLLIGPGALYETPPTHVGTGAISIICTAASTSVYAREG